MIMADKTEQPKKKMTDGRNMQNNPEFSNMMKGYPAVIARERSFVRTANQQNVNKRRSLAVLGDGSISQARNKPSMDIYRPKFNQNLQQTSSSTHLHHNSASPGILQQARTPMEFYQPIHYVATNSNMNRRQMGYSLGNTPITKGQQHRQILITHSNPLSPNLPLVNSPSSNNILNQTVGMSRVKFAKDYQNVHKTRNGNNNVNEHKQFNAKSQQLNDVSNMAEVSFDANNMNALQRSKSLSSADALTRGIAGLGLGLGNNAADIGQFNPEVQALIDTALENPNTLNSRCLMELTSYFLKRAVEARRYALPISRLCLKIIAKEEKETFLEAILNTCRHWFQEREKLLFAIQGMKSPSRVRFTAFMAFLTEMFCQLKRRQIQLRTQVEGTPPHLVLLTLLSKCCEDCVRPPIKSAAEIECLYYVLTCIGQDLELQLPQQLDVLLTLIRDAFLNTNDSAPVIRRTLLQLIELQASHWQLPGNTVLYYYPSAK